MDNWINWAAGIMAIINASWLIVQGWKRLKPEVKKMETDADLDILEGAAKSQQMLIDRINDLQSQLNLEREARKADLQQERAARQAELETERAARTKSEEYLRRRIREAEREARDYRQWAAKLVKQVVEAGKVPAAFIPSSEDSETGISAIRPDSKGEQ